MVSKGRTFFLSTVFLCVFLFVSGFYKSEASEYHVYCCPFSDDANCSQIATAETPEVADGTFEASTECCGDFNDGTNTCIGGFPNCNEGTCANDPNATCMKCYLTGSNDVPGADNDGDGSYGGGTANPPPPPPPPGDDGDDGGFNCSTGTGALSIFCIDFTEVLGVFYKLLYPAGIGLGIIMIAKAGYALMMSQGEPNTVRAAQEDLTSAILGVLFILLSVVILRVIINQILGGSVNF